jgi:hypothetical protein
MGGRKERVVKPKRLRSSEAPTAKETPAKSEIDTCTYQRFAAIPYSRLTYSRLSPTKKIVVLADFPLHVPGGLFPPPAGHYATWLPQLAEAFAEEKDFEFHWLTLDPSLPEEVSLQGWGQTFHVLPSWRRGRAATLFWADRRRIHQKLGQIGPDLVHGWGNENIWGWAAVSSGFPNIFSLQGLLSEYLKLGGVSLRDRLMAKIEIYVLNKAQVVTTESPWAKEKIDLLKIDVEGFEFEVLQGARKVLAKTQAILVEVSLMRGESLEPDRLSKMLALLAGAGMMTEAVVPSWYSVRNPWMPVEFNILARRED